MINYDDAHVGHICTPFACQHGWNTFYLPRYFYLFVSKILCVKTHPKLLKISKTKCRAVLGPLGREPRINLPQSYSRLTPFLRQ
jgi:hypothetical protein